MNGQTNQPSLKLAVFSAAVWQHVCPVVRITAPAQACGVQIFKGNQWANGDMRLDLDAIAEADGVVITRDFAERSADYEAVLERTRRQNKPLIYEIDDLLSELPEEHPDYRFYRVARSAVLRAAVDADAIVTATPEIQAYLQPFNPRIHVFPNFLPEKLWNPESRPGFSQEPIVIGYQAGHSHLYDLEEIVPALASILKKYENGVLFRLWGFAPPPALRDLPNVEWSIPGLVDYADFARFFLQQQCDIGIAPLKNNLFNRSKSHLKYLEYSWLAIPGVYGRVTPYEKLVNHTVNGFLAGSLEEWESCLSALIENPGLRQRTGAAARAAVQENWLLSDHAVRWLEVYQDLVHKGRLPEKPASSLALAKKMYLWEHELEGKIASQDRQIEEIVEKTSDQIYQLNAKVKGLEGQIYNLEARMAERTQTIEYIHGLYLEIMRSRGWKVMQRLFAIRRAVLPPASKREALLKFALASPRTLLRQGGKAWLDNARQTWRRLRTPPGQEAPAPGSFDAPVVRVVDGALCPSPALSIIVLRSDQPISEGDVAAWRQQQTFASLAEIIIWDLPSGTAWRLADPGRPWKAAAASELCQSLSSPYLCIASDDLISSPATFLEENLTALLTEPLLLTLNTKGSPAWVEDLLSRGMAPVKDAYPLHRMFVRKEYLKDNWEIDIDRWLAERKGFVHAIGRIINQATNQPDEPGAMQFEQKFPIDRCEFKIKKNRIFARSKSAELWKAPYLKLYPLESVIPETVSPCDKPTVIMVFTFLAVGGAERIHLNIMRCLKDQIRFVVVGIEELDPELGTTADEFRSLTPYVYTAPGFVDHALSLSFMDRLIRQFQPQGLYIANGANTIYNILGDIKRKHPGLRVSNQVYDHQAGWINRYDIGLVLNIDAHIGVNQKICQAYRDQGAQEDQVFLIENGIFPDEFDPSLYTESVKTAIKKKLGLPEDKKIVAFASRVHPQKRPLDFVELARRFRSDPSTAFLMIGDGPLAARVDEEIARIGLDNIYRRPFYRPMSDIYAICNAFVLPSMFEGMPMVIIEAQAMGAPVVVTDVGNNRQVVEYTGGGRVIDKIGDIASLMQAVQEMLDRPPDPASLRERTLARFDIHMLAQQYKTAILGNSYA